MRSGRVRREPRIGTLVPGPAVGHVLERMGAVAPDKLERARTWPPQGRCWSARTRADVTTRDVLIPGGSRR